MIDKNQYQDADGSNAEIDEGMLSEIEKIREKTFDSEFKDLVSRVTSHRSDDIDIHKETEKELLTRYQKLFYRASNLYWRENARILLDPFRLPETGLDENIALDIFTEMDAIGFPHFAILTYDFKKKSFACRINHITQLNRDNLVLDTDEQIFRKTVRSKHGFLLRRTDIEKDAFLKKRLTSEQDGRIPGTFYFLSLEFLWDMIREECGAELPDGVPKIPTILIVLIEGSDYDDSEGCFAKIRENLSLELAIYKNMLYPNVAEYCNGTMDGAFSILDYYYTLYCRVMEGGVMLLGYSSCGAPEHDYVYAFFTEKILSRFENKTALVSIDRYASFLFYHVDLHREITKFVKELCAETGNFITIVPVDRQNMSSLNGLLSEYLKMERE
jgi:hypothetical protein